MFCAKCGKQIEDDSTFCPFCGQQVDAPVVDKRSVISAKTMIKDGVKKSSALQGILSNKKIWGTALALAAVVAIGIVGVKLVGGLSNRMKSVPEKLFDMSWDEFSKTSLDDMKDMLDDADIFYADDFSVPGFETTTAEPFFEGESIFWHGVSMPPEFAFAVGFKSIDEFKDFKDSLENYLDKRIIKNAAVMSDNGSRSSAIYPIEVSTKNLEHYIDAYAEYATYTGITDSANTNTIDLEDEAYAVYKFVSVEYTQESLESYAEEASFWLDEEYIQRCCLINVTYRLMKEEDFIMMQAQCGHDAISGKELDLDDFIESIVTYRSEQEQSGLKMVDTMTLGAKGDRIVKITEVIDVDMSSFSETEQEQMTVAYGALVEQYSTVDGVECTGNAGSGTYTFNITIDAIGDAVERLASQNLLAIEGNGGKLSLKATGESLKAEGYKLVE